MGAAQLAEGLAESGGVGGDLDELTSAIIGAAMAVHTDIGPGFLEAIYEEALCIELGTRKMAFERQLPVTVTYRGVESAGRG